MIDGLAMKISDSNARELGEFFDAADADDFFEIFGGPERDRSSPVSVSGNTPVVSILEPVAESLLLHMTWYPGCHVVRLEKLISGVLNTDKPRRHGFVNKRCSRSPAERVAMLDLSLLYHSIFSLQCFDYFKRWSDSLSCRQFR